MRKRFFTLPVIAGAMSLLVASPASASVIWDGDAAQGTAAFAAIECAAPGSVTVADDNAHGKIFKFNKSAGVLRCEGRGMNVGGSEYAFNNNTTHYLGWQFFVNADNAATVWQWKSVPNSQQNYPVLMKVEDAQLKLFQVAQGEVWKLIWSTPVTANTWQKVAVGIHTSDSAIGGWVEFYYNGVKQTFTDGSTRYVCRTWDTYNVPKWGTYGADIQNTSVINWIDSLKVGTTYADVD